MEFLDSVVLISKSDGDKSAFGTGFVIRRSTSAVFVVTCAHVVEDIDGSEGMLVDGQPAIVAKSGYEDGLDLAVLRVQGLWSKPTLKLAAGGKSGKSILTAGFRKFDNSKLVRPLTGQLGNQVELQTKNSGKRIPAWDLKITTDDYRLEPGYSGSPIIDDEAGRVIGIVSHRQSQGEIGLAISVEALDYIWRIIDSDQLYGLLVKLGYRQQTRQFRRLINNHAVAALLIYGAPEYGQRWLLNRLVNQYLPNSVTGKIIKIDLFRRSQQSDVKALWRELAKRVGLGSKAPTSEIIERIYKWWETQNVLLIFHGVDILTEPCFQELVEDFWLPLANRARDYLEGNQGYKLLLFFIDYDGCVGNWNAPFVEKIDSVWRPHIPIRSPKLVEISDDDLMDWIGFEYTDLPHDFANEDAIIQEILENSEDGIPEQVLQDICDRCGFDWYEESDKWMKH